MNESTSIMSRAVPGPAPGVPRAAQRVGEHAVEPADVPERERPQKRPQRRRRQRPMPKHPLGAPRAQHRAVVDRVGPEQHRVHQRQHLASRARRARPLAEVDAVVDEPLDAQPPPDHHRQHEPGVGDRAIVIETDIESIRPGVHHAADLLTTRPGCPIQPQNASSEGHPSRTPGQNQPATPVDRG
jgi:hypothetical protein